MNHTEILNYLISKYNYKTYLEIGTFNGVNFENIEAEYKECCDITDVYYKDINYLMTSDEMFATMDPKQKYDIIFIDGLHLEDQLDRDIINSLKHLNKNGVILCHDTLPGNPKAAINYRDLTYNGMWTGTCYKSICKLNNENIEYYTIDSGDHGITIIKYCDYPHQLTFNNYKCDQSYNNLFVNQNNNEYQMQNNYTLQGKFVLHIITEHEFLNIF